MKYGLNNVGLFYEGLMADQVLYAKKGEKRNLVLANYSEVLLLVRVTMKWGKQEKSILVALPAESKADCIELFILEDKVNLKIEVFANPSRFPMESVPLMFDKLRWIHNESPEELGDFTCLIEEDLYMVKFR